MTAAPLRESISPKEVRRTILQQSKRANVGHIGSCLSIVEILCVLYERVLRISSPEDPDRDRFILSKGHAALALYAVLREKGWLSDCDLNTFCGENTLLGVHPESALHGVDFSTGSLGHGLTFAGGAALAARMQGSERNVFCVVSDAECNEGSVWEAVMFAAHHRLGNLRVIIDLNGQQALGLTKDIINTSNMAARWETFGWKASECDGHSMADLSSAITRGSAVGAPEVILARTTFGRGVSYMEQGVAITQSHLPDQPVNWHYLPMSDAEYEIAMSGLEVSL